MEDLLQRGFSNADDASIPRLVEEVGRFRVWSGNIGAHRLGRISLDHRLRQSSRMRNTVISFLDDLFNALQEGEDAHYATMLIYQIWL